MPTPDEPTMPFTIMPYMMIVEGTATRLGLLLGMLYEDKELQRDQWSADHDAVSRKAAAAKLKPEGAKIERMGVGALTERTREILMRRAEALGLKVKPFQLEPRG